MSVSGVQITGPMKPGYETILTDEALAFLAGLHRRFETTRRERLAARAALQARLDAGEKLGFLPETAAIRGAPWKVGSIPADLQDRRVEITGPVDRKMVINALNSGAKCFMACFEDASTPAWEIMVDGQINLRDAVAGTIELTDERTGKEYRLGKETATLIARPRGWHLLEKHVHVDGEPI